MSEKWQVSISFDELDEMRTARKKAELRCVELEKKLADTQLGGDGSIASTLTEALRSSLKLIQWAQGNYDPESVRGWPYEALRQLAKAIKAMPGATQHEIEWADDAMGYATMAEVIERARKEGRQKDLGQIPRGLVMTGPKAYAEAAERLLSEAPEELKQQAGGEQQQAQPTGVVPPSPTTVPVEPATAPAVTAE